MGNHLLRCMKIDGWLTYWWEQFERGIFKQLWEYANVLWEGCYSKHDHRSLTFVFCISNARSQTACSGSNPSLIISLSSVPAQHEHAARSANTSPTHIAINPQCLMWAGQHSVSHLYSQICQLMLSLRCRPTRASDHSNHADSQNKHTLYLL